MADLPLMTPVSSSNVDEIGFDEDEEILYIRFLNGSLYQYWGVPESVYFSFMGAPSMGKFVWQYIRGQYEYARIE